MPGFNPDKINIHDLTIEEPEKQSEVIFEPKRDIEKENWMRMKNELKELKDGKHWHGFAKLAMYLKILDPYYTLNVDEDSWKEMLGTLEKFKTQANKKADGSLDVDWRSLFSMASAMKILDPDKNVVDKPTLGRMKKYFEGVRDGEFWMALPDLAKNMKILDPNYDLELSSSNWSDMEKWLDSCRGGYHIFSDVAASMRIIGPAYNLNLTEEDWSGMKRKIEGGAGFSGYASHVADMKILAAEKIEVSQKGLEITMPGQKLDPETPQLPESRNF